LNTKEQSELLKRFHETRDTETRSIIIERNLRLVYHVVKKFRDCIVSEDDLAGAGSVGLIKAVDNFDPERNTKFATYASRCIQNEMYMAIRNRRKASREISLEEVIVADNDGNDMFLHEKISTDETAEDVALMNIDKDNLKRILEDEAKNRRVSDDMKVLHMRFGLSGTKIHTQAEIADALGISRSYVSRIERRAISRLGKKYREALL